MKPGSAIFAGTVVSSEPGSDNPAFATRRYTFQVDEALYGLEGSSGRVTVEVDASTSCAMRFDDGARYLVFASQGSGGRFVTGRCSRTRRLDEARSDIEALRDAATGVTRGRLTGRVVDVWLRLSPSGAVAAGDYDPVPGIEVVASGPSGQERASTDAEGWFTFAGLDAGRYAVRVRPTANRVARVATSEVVIGRCGNGTTLVTELRSLEATVVDVGGRPVAAGVRLSLIPDESSPPASRTPRAWLETGADGRVSLSGVPAGRYRLGVSVVEPPTARTPYPPTWYGDGAGRSILEISNRHTTRVVFSVPRRLSTRRIEGVVTDAAGRPPADSPYVWVYDSEAPDERLATVRAVLGRFTFDGIVGRSYEFQAGLTGMNPSPRVAAPAGTAQVTLMLPN